MVCPGGYDEQSCSIFAFYSTFAARVNTRLRTAVRSSSGVSAETVIAGRQRMQLLDHASITVRDVQKVKPLRRFYEAGLAAGGTPDGAPGVRAHHHAGYYAAFVVDPEGNRLEAVYRHG
jgi:hypothetical protein